MVSDDIDGSATSYTIEYSQTDSMSNCSDSVVIPASSCGNNVCNHVFYLSTHLVL